MKHAILSVLISLLTVLSALAQDSTSARSFLPDQRDLGVMVNVNGLINNISASTFKDYNGISSMTIRYTMDPRLTFRIGLAPTVSRFHVARTDSVGKDLVAFDSTARQSAFSLRPGLEYHFTGSKRLDPYVALDLEGGVTGRFSSGSVTNVTDTTGTAKFTRTITEDGGFILGARLGLGMNYFVAKRFCLGMEYGFNAMSNISGGDRQEVLQAEPVSGTPSTTRVLSSNRVNNFSTYVDPTVRLTLCYFFNT